MNASPSPEAALRRLYLMLFLRGRSARLTGKDKAPQSVGRKLALSLLIYAAIGVLSLYYLRQPLFSLSLSLHSMTFILVGMFVASSAGEVLFNREEADILLHRPVDPGTLLWAKIRVLVQISLWMAGAFNAVGLLVGVFGRHGSWYFPLVHALSTVLLALCVTSAIVILYQLCLQWFGRERLDALLTVAQVLAGVLMATWGQILPRLVERGAGSLVLQPDAWWMALLPPAWFAGLDDLLAGQGGLPSLGLAGVGVGITALLIWLAFGRLAGDYERGLRRLAESTPASRTHRSGWMDRLVRLPLLRRWIGSGVDQAAFRLSAAYLLRDRDTKLRIYPAIGPVLVWPVVMLFTSRGGQGTSTAFMIAFMGGFIGMAPMTALDLLRHSQDWHASDLFRAAPLESPAGLAHGARRAVLLFLALPIFTVMAGLAMLIKGGAVFLLLLLPGLMATPIYAMVACLRGGGVPLSQPIQEGQNAQRLPMVLAVVAISVALAGLSALAWHFHVFGYLLVAEALVAAGLYVRLRKQVGRTRWADI